MVLFWHTTERAGRGRAAGIRSDGGMPAGGGIGAGGLLSGPGEWPAGNYRHAGRDGQPASGVLTGNCGQSWSVHGAWAAAAFREFARRVQFGGAGDHAPASLAGAITLWEGSAAKHEEPHRA